MHRNMSSRNVMFDYKKCCMLEVYKCVSSLRKYHFHMIVCEVSLYYKSKEVSLFNCHFSNLFIVSYIS